MYVQSQSNTLAATTGKSSSPAVVSFMITGCMNSPSYQKAKLIAEMLQTEQPKNVTSRFVPLTGFDWSTRLRNLRQEEDVKELYDQETEVIVKETHSGRLFPTCKAFSTWVEETFGLVDVRPLPLYKALANSEYQAWKMASKHTLVSFEVGIEGVPETYKLVFELFDDLCPRTVKNFKKMMAGFLSPLIHRQVGYTGTFFHRLVRKGWLQGGDIYNSGGDGGESMYGKYFEDENFIIPHDQPGILSMVGQGKHKNGSQFMISLKAMPCFDHRYVAFGRLIEGHAFLAKLDDIPCSFADRPETPIQIEKVGVVYDPAEESAED